MGEDDAALRAALNYSCAVTERWLRDKRIEIPELDPKYSEIVRCFVPVWRKRAWDHPNDPNSDKAYEGFETFEGYEISPQNEEVVARAFHSDRRAALLIADRISTNVGLGAPMPIHLRAIAALLVRGRIGLPRGARPSERERDILICGVIDRIRDWFSFPAGYNPSAASRAGGAAIRCGAEIVTATLCAHGLNVDVKRVQKIYYEGRDLRDVARNHVSVFMTLKMQNLLMKPSNGQFGANPEILEKASRHFGLSPN